MKVSVHRLLVVSVVVTITAFITAGVVGNHRGGLVGTIADIAWFTFLIGLLVTVVLAVFALVRSASQRRRGSQPRNVA